MHIALHQTVIGFIVSRHSAEVYGKILKEADIDKERFEAENYHNDVEVDRVIAAAGRLLSQSRDDFLSDVGIHGAPGLLEAFKGFLDCGWNTLDLVENVESRMHKHVREEMGAFPPALKTERVNAHEIRVDVLSHRKMAGLARGFILGFARHYGETVTIDIDASDTGYSFSIKKTG